MTQLLKVRNTKTEPFLMAVSFSAKAEACSSTAACFSFTSSDASCRSRNMRRICSLVKLGKVSEWWERRRDEHWPIFVNASSLRLKGLPHLLCLANGPHSSALAHFEGMFVTCQCTKSDTVDELDRKQGRRTWPVRPSSAVDAALLPSGERPPLPEPVYWHSFESETLPFPSPASSVGIFIRSANK